MKKDNPARRLHTLLTIGKEIEAGYGTGDALRKVFDLPKEASNMELRRKLIRLEELFIAVIDIATNELPDGSVNIEHIKNCLNKAFLELNMKGQWESFIRHVDVHVMTGLLMVSTVIDFHPNDFHVHLSSLTEEQLKDLKVQSSLLLEDVIESGFPEELKIFIVSHVQKIQEAIDDYRISGAVPIIESIEGAFGHVGVRSYQDEEYKAKLASSGLGDKIKSSIGLMADTIQIVTAAPQLTIAMGFLLKS